VSRFHPGTVKIVPGSVLPVLPQLVQVTQGEPGSLRLAHSVSTIRSRQLDGSGRIVVSAVSANQESH
jgi:hypothetical protein